MASACCTVVSCRTSPSVLIPPPIPVLLSFLSHSSWSVLTAASDCLAFFSSSVTKTDTGESCWAKTSQARRGKESHLFLVAGSFTVIHRAAAGLTALSCFFNCCRQKPDQSALGVCFIVSILCCQSQKQGTLTQRKTDDGNLWCARWGVCDSILSGTAN